MANNTNISRRTLLSAAGLAMAGGFTAPAAANHNGDPDQYPEPQSQSKKESYEKTVLSDRMNNLIDLSVADDGRVFYITRGDFFVGEIGGTTEVGVIDPETGEDTVVLKIPVFTGIRMEDGGQGIALDPNFQENGYIYLYYSPSNEEVADTQEELDYLNQAGSNGDATVDAPVESSVEPYNLLSRVTMENGSIDPATETEILRVPVQRDLCCHEGGDIQWGPNGENLYLTTGDNTYSKAETDVPGFAPLDEREGRAYYDAQRSAANTADLRGKIIRITPQHDDQGSYTIPEGNLQEWWENKTGETYSDEEILPEIYVMGVRNPYQAGVDMETGTLLWGDYSADSRVWSDVRGPPGFNEFNRATNAGNYGWPYFSGPYPYYDYNYTTEEKTGIFDSTPINDSPHSDGIEQLPPVTKPFIWYPGDWSRALNTDPSDDVPDVPSDFDVPEEPPFPNFEGGAPVGGPVYRYQESYTERGLPQWHDGDYIIGEFGDNWIRTVSFENDDVANGEVAQISPLAPDLQFRSPLDLELGPEGMLYVAEYGAFSGQGSKLSRIERQTGQEKETRPVSVPFGYDAGGALLDGTVTIDGLEYVASSPAVEMYGDASASKTGTAAATNVYPRPPNPIAGTQNDALYQSEAFGGNLSFDVTVENGTYDVVLYFAETNTGIPKSGDSARVFNVAIEGNQVLSEFNIAAEDGYNTAVQRTFEGIQVSDGVLTISTETISDNSKFSGFAILPSDGGGDGGDAIDPATTIKLGGDTTEGWIGQAPSSIDGRTNPTLPLLAGETYTVVWENLDGRNHDFDILDAQGNTLVDSGRMNVEGATKTVKFTVTPEMAEYYCSVHPIVMHGTLDIQEGDGGDGPPPVVGDSPPTDPNGDGLYEDVNGDGEVNHDDVTALFEHFGDDAVQNNPDAYDFNGNGRLDYDDIVELSRSM